MPQVLSDYEIADQIYLIRGLQVMLDRDLARLYQVETSALKRAVKRNIGRFPKDFMFELTKEEGEILRCQIGISNVENYVENPVENKIGSQNETSNLGNSLEKQVNLSFQFGAPKVENYVENGLICQIGTSNVENYVENSEPRGGDRFLPFVFTESGVAMLSSVLRSEKAIQVNIAIMRTFIHLRKQRDFRTESMDKIQNLESSMHKVNWRLERIESKFKIGNERSITPDRKDQIEGKQRSFLRNHSDVVGVDQVLQIQKQVSKHFQLEVKDLMSESRVRSLVSARQIAIYLTRENLRLGFVEIGKYFCRKDHTTIMHSYKKVQSEIKKNKAIKEAVFSIQKKINQTDVT